MHIDKHLVNGEYVYLNIKCFQNSFSQPNQMVSLNKLISCVDYGLDLLNLDSLVCYELALYK